MTRAEVNAIGTMLAGVREKHEGALIVSFAACAPSHDTPGGHMEATVEAAGHSETGRAVSLFDAITIARHKLAAGAKVRAEKAAKEKEAA